MEALKPFAVDNYLQDPAPFQYLQHNDKYTFDVKLSVPIQPEGGQPTTGVFFNIILLISPVLPEREGLYIELLMYPKFYKQNVSFISSKLYIYLNPPKRNRH